MKYRLALVVLVAWGAALGCSPTQAGPQRVNCGGIPGEGVLDLDLETVWEQPAESEDFLLAGMTHAACDEQGNICVVDFQQRDLKIFDPQGNWLRTLGREGEGPGESEDARMVFFAGDRYGLLQAFPAAIVWLNADGTPGGKVAIGGHDPENMVFISAAHAVQTPGGIYAWISRTRYADGESETQSWIAGVAADGSLGPVLYDEPDQPSARVDGGIDEGRVYDIWLRRWTGDDRGGLWVAPERDRYLLQHWNAAGELVLQVEREYEPRVRNEEGRQGILDWFVRRGWNLDQIRVGRTAPVVRELRLGDDGNLWVGLDLGGPDADSDLIRIFDVISPAGEYLRQIRLHSDLEPGSSAMLDDHRRLTLSTDPQDGETMLVLQQVTPAD